MAENFDHLFAQMSPSDIGIWQQTMQSQGRGDEAAGALGARGGQRDAIAQAMMAQQAPQRAYGGGGGYGGGNPYAGQGWWSTFVQNVGPEAAQAWAAQQGGGGGGGMAAAPAAQQQAQPSYGGYSGYGGYGGGYGGTPMGVGLSASDWAIFSQAVGPDAAQAWAAQQRGVAPNDWETWRQQVGPDLAQMWLYGSGPSGGGEAAGMGGMGGGGSVGGGSVGGGSVGGPAGGGGGGITWSSSSR